MVYILLLITVFLQAQNMETIISAKDVSELLTQDEVSRQKLSNKEGCELEIKNQWFPNYCIRELEQTLSLPQKDEELPEVIKQVDQACRDTYKEVRSPTRLMKIIDNYYLPQNCKEILLRHHADLVYMSH